MLVRSGCVPQPTSVRIPGVGRSGCVPQEVRLGVYFSACIDLCV